MTLSRPEYRTLAGLAHDAARGPGLVAVMAAFCWLQLGPATPVCRAAESTPYLDAVQRYVDTMIEKGRDTYGSQKSGLLLSAIDRLTLKPLTTRPASPSGVRRSSFN